jgi:hypothetical protein
MGSKRESLPRRRNSLKKGEKDNERERRAPKSKLDWVCLFLFLIRQHIKQAEQSHAPKKKRSTDEEKQQHNNRRRRRGSRKIGKG